MFGIYQEIDFNQFKVGKRIHVVNYNEDKSYFGTIISKTNSPNAKYNIKLKDNSMLSFTCNDLKKEVYGVNILTKSNW